MLYIYKNRFTEEICSNFYTLWLDLKNSRFFSRFTRRTLLNLPPVFVNKCICLHYPITNYKYGYNFHSIYAIFVMKLNEKGFPCFCRDVEWIFVSIVFIMILAFDFSIKWMTVTFNDVNLVTYVGFQMGTNIVHIWWSWWCFSIHSKDWKDRNFRLNLTNLTLGSREK